MSLPPENARRLTSCSCSSDSNKLRKYNALGLDRVGLLRSSKGGKHAGSRRQCKRAWSSTGLACTTKPKPQQFRKELNINAVWRQTSRESRTPWDVLEVVTSDHSKTKVTRVPRLVPRGLAGTRRFQLQKTHRNSW